MVACEWLTLLALVPEQEQELELALALEPRAHRAMWLVW